MWLSYRTLAAVARVRSLDRSRVNSQSTVAISWRAQPRRLPLAIVRTADTSFVAFSRICPHQGGTIQTTSSGFQCPVHGATFDRSGQWVGGQRTSNMRQYPVTYDAAAGTLTID